MELNFEVVTWKFAYICCIFIDIGLVAVLYDYNFPKQDLLKNSLIAFFFAAFSFVIQPILQRRSRCMFRQCLTPCLLEVFHCISVHSKIATLKMGVNKQFITNITSSAKKRFLIKV